ncbi:hypothetical protein [Ornithinimicrobium pratense]|uniref:Uncharacterized protein n=1 Tax=Ornithinimicrobium pratense TaxID=2593973 RepID=A0A5J6V259_9MICO|nr:hypothetical protein [Ornithinimicrobium pratense]QFG67374.1 hypothetical protein FY030_00320 [Ornithinimicrobium pratense]
MTYDITLYPRTPGQSWADVVAADEQDGPPVDEAALQAGVAAFRRIEARLREHLTEPVEVWVAEETDGDVFGELTASESGLQVELYDRSASVSFPVRAREDRAHFLDQVRRAVRIVATETGYEAYDPQTGRSFDGLIEEEGLSPDDLTHLTPAAPSTVTAGETTEHPAAAGGAGAAALQQMDPRMLRRRSILYIVLGAILAVFAFLRFAEGDTGWFAWLIAGFAAFNLIAGVMLRGLSKQAEARAEAGDAAGDTTDDTTPGGPAAP